MPLIATILSIDGRKVLSKTGIQSLLLSVMLLGGAFFGVIDHLWNAELFLISTNWIMDMALGFTITAMIVASWWVITFRMHLPKLEQIESRTGIYKAR